MLVEYDQQGCESYKSEVLLDFLIKNHMRIIVTLLQPIEQPVDQQNTAGQTQQLKDDIDRLKRDITLLKEQVRTC